MVGVMGACGDKAETDWIVVLTVSLIPASLILSAFVNSGQSHRWGIGECQRWAVWVFRIPSRQLHKQDGQERNAGCEDNPQ